VWFYGKLLPAAFCETVVNKARFPLERMRRLDFVERPELSLVLASMLIPEVLDMGEMMGNLRMLPKVCANSKRKREPPSGVS
jgi:hypothetical protein